MYALAHSLLPGEEGSGTEAVMKYFVLILNMAMVLLPVMMMRRRRATRISVYCEIKHSQPRSCGEMI